MTSETSAALTKTCCACGTSVSGMARMKDSQGKYWCIACGEADQRRKQMTATTATCAACRKSFPKGKLDKDGEWFFCKPCLKKRTKLTKAAAGRETSDSPSSASPVETDKRRKLMLAGVVVLLLVVSLLFNFVFAHG